MVKLGSGGANFSGYHRGEWLNDQDYILGQLPLAQAQSFIQVYWLSQHQKRCRKPDTGQRREGLQRLLD